VTLLTVTIVADMTIHPATLAETDIRTLDHLRLLITAIILHPVVVHLATFTMIGETTADLHRLRVMMVVLLTLNMIIHLATHTCHAPDTVLLQGTCMNGALLTVTPIHPPAIVLGHPVLQGDVMNSGNTLHTRRALDIVVAVLPDRLNSRLKGIAVVPSLLPEAMVALQVILQMARVLDGIQVHPLVVHLRHVVLLVVLAAARVVACLGVAVMIENTVLAGTVEILVRL